MKGYRGTVFDSLPYAGGTMLIGVPAFRLPRDVIELDVNWVAKHGVQFHYNVEIGRDITLEQLRAQHAAEVVRQFRRMAPAEHEPAVRARKAGPRLEHPQAGLQPPDARPPRSMRLPPGRPAPAPLRGALVRTARDAREPGEDREADDQGDGADEDAAGEQEVECDGGDEDAEHEQAGRRRDPEDAALRLVHADSRRSPCSRERGPAPAAGRHLGRHLVAAGGAGRRHRPRVPAAAGARPQPPDPGGAPRPP